MLGSGFFVGMTILVVFVTRLGDVIGRKWPTNISSMVSIPITIGLILSRDLNLSIGLLILFGATCPGREQVAFVYISELVPLKNRTAVGSLLLLADATTIGWIALYFLYVSKDWVYFQCISVTLNCIATVMLLFIPESPKYLHSRGSY